MSELGPIVLLVRYSFDNELDAELLPAALACEALHNDYENGVVWQSGKIYWFGINSRNWDTSP